MSLLFIKVKSYTKFIVKNVIFILTECIKQVKINNVRRSGGMADAQASGACGSNTVWVQVPSPAFFNAVKLLICRRVNVLFRY